MIGKLVLVLVFLGVQTVSRGADWPQWRGVHRDAKSPETGLLAQWPDQGPRLAWKAEDLGGGYSTPSVADGKIFGMGYRDGQEVVWALEESSGKMIWTAPIARADTSIDYSEGSRATPTVDGDMIYVLGAGGELTCLSAARGRVQWSVNLKEDFSGKMMSGWGYSESPLVDGNLVVCTPGGRSGALLALDKTTGKPVWRTEDLRDEAAYSSIVTATLYGQRQYIQLTGEHVVSVAPRDGRILWLADRPGKTAVIPTPVVDPPFVFVTSGYNVGCNLFEVEQASDGFTVSEIYANRNMKNHHGGVVRVGDYIYGTDESILTCLELKTGKVAWEERSVGKGSIAFADGHLYVRSEQGPVALVEATPKGYREKGRFDQPNRSNERSWPHPVIANGRLLLRDMDILLAYDIKAR